MIAAWMLYTILVTLIIFAAASAAEYVARALRLPTRAVWMIGMAGAVGLSARALVPHGATSPRTAPIAATTPSLRLDFPARTAAVVSRAARLASVSRITSRVDTAPLERLNRGLIAAWITSSLLVLAWFGVSLSRLRRLARGLAVGVVGNDPVLVSRDIGPAVFGVLRTRIVLPRWVLELPPAERDTIVAHERQHAAAFDPALVCVSACVIALQPWNVALWALFSRLRLALEADCDSRVLAQTGNARAYGKLLIAIYERTTPALSPHIAFADGESHLESRIRRLATRPRVYSPAVAASGAIAIALVTAAWTAAAPGRARAASASPMVTITPRAETDSAPLAVRPPATPATPARDSVRATDAEQAVQTTPVPTSPAASPSALRLGRCSIFEHVTLRGEDFTVNAAATGTPDTTSHPLLFPAAGCAMYGDVMLMTLDSTRIVVSARDTADANLAVTDVLILQMKRGTVPAGLSWYTKAGRALLTDSVFYYAAPGRRTVAVRFTPGATIRESNALVIETENMTAIHSRFVTWDVLPDFPTASRCAPVLGADPSAHACVMVKGQRVEFPIPQ